YDVSEPEAEHVDSGGDEGVPFPRNTLDVGKDASTNALGVSACVPVHGEGEDAASVGCKVNDVMMEQVDGERR
ncbi:hypothetical protein A2U01_0105211, partial [Trifolium medium]|nr:hypothetical protein [Trifolium medium]